MENGTTYFTKTKSKMFMIVTLQLPPTVTYYFFTYKRKLQQQKFCSKFQRSDLNAMRILFWPSRWMASEKMVGLNHNPKPRHFLKLTNMKC